MIRYNKYGHSSLLQSTQASSNMKMKFGLYLIKDLKTKNLENDKLCEIVVIYASYYRQLSVDIKINQFSQPRGTEVPD